jgi:hypothetical protein
LAAALSLRVHAQGGSVLASEAKQSSVSHETLDCFVALASRNDVPFAGGGGMQTELNRLVAALREFYAQEAFLLDNELGERALTHRLAVHLERHYPGWEVDCEYNRLGERALRLPRGTIVSTDDPLGKSIFPDIVVHRRAIPNNLLAVEEGLQPPADRARSAQAPGTDGPGYLVRL